MEFPQSSGFNRIHYYVVVQNYLNFLFRFFLVKYANRGLTQSGTSDLWPGLYAVSAISFNLYSFIVPLLASIRDYQGAILTKENITSFSDKIVFRHFSCVNDSDKEDPDHYVQLPTAFLAITSLSFICMWIFFFCVKYIKLKMPNLKRQYQRNILTFNQNFFFYISFFIISVSLTLVKLIVPLLTSPENTKLILIFLYIIKLMFVSIFRPMIIIFLLRRRMPHFFENYKRKNSVISIFYVSGKTVCARNELFKPLKSFSQDARFGSEKKFNELNLRVENNSFIHHVLRNKEKHMTTKSKLFIGRRKMNVKYMPDVH